MLVAKCVTKVCEIHCSLNRLDTLAKPIFIPINQPVVPAKGSILLDDINNTVMYMYMCSSVPVMT